MKYDKHTVELVKSQNGSVMLVHLDKKYCFDWYKELVNQYNLAIQYARQAAVQFTIEISDYGKPIKRPHIAFEEDLIAFFTAASHTAEVKTNEAGKAWVDSSNGLGEFETDDPGYAFLYLTMPKTVEKIAIASDAILRHTILL